MVFVVVITLKKDICFLSNMQYINTKLQSMRYGKSNRTLLEHIFVPKFAVHIFSLATVGLGCLCAECFVCKYSGATRG
jgi:hypothetical protein